MLLPVPATTTATTTATTATTATTTATISSRTATLELLLTCARTTLTNQDQERIQTLLEAGIDWDEFSHQAYRHKVVALIFPILNRLGSDRIPPTLLKDFQSRAQTTAIRNLIRLRHLNTFLTSLNKAGIHAMAYKGPSLATVAYGNLNLREFSDLDILVSSDQGSAAKAVLKNQGFEEGADIDYECELIHPHLGLSIDLHRHLFPPFFQYPETLATLTPRLIPIDCEGYKLYSLNPEDLFLFLVLQLGKDCSNLRLRLAQICDIAELLRSHPQLDWAIVLQRANAMGAMRLLGLSLYLCREWLGVSVPAEVCQQCSIDDPHILSLVQGIQTKLWDTEGHPEFENPTFMDFLQTQDHSFYLQMRERRIDRWRYILWWIGAIVSTAVSPTDGDRQLISLPFPLRFLYFPIHWGRMFVKYPLAFLKTVG
jgi:hypothetical protein